MNSNPLHIMIEGPDGAGKSTIAEHLSVKLGLPIRVMYTNKHIFETCIEECSEIFNRMLADLKDTSFILPRGFISSLVYSKVYKRNYDLNYIEHVAKLLTPVVIYLQVDKDVIRKRKEDQFTNDKIFDIIDAYEDFFSNPLNLAKYNYELIKINTSILTVDQTVENLGKLLNI